MNEKGMYSSYRWLILLAGCVAILSAYTDMIVYAPILGGIAEDLKIGMGPATNLMMAFVLAVAFVLIWGGVVCDKYGITSALVLGLLCASVPAVLMPWIGHNYGVVLLFRLIQGASVGFIFATIGPITALWFPAHEQGLAGGILLGGISIGSALGVVASPALFGAVASWQTTVAILSIPGWIGIVLALLITRRPPSLEVAKGLMEAMKSQAGEVTFSKALTLPMTWICSFIIFFNAWGLYCLYNLVPPYLAAKAPMGVGLGAATAGAISLALTIVGIFAPLVGGIFFDKVGKGNPRPGVIIGFILSGFFTYLVLTSPVYGSMGLLVICLMIAGWGIPFMNPSLSAFIVMNYPPSIVGRMVGFCFGFGTFGGALGLYLGGMTIGKLGTFFWAIAMVSIAAIVGFILAFFLKSRKA